jgi:transcriptional regulator of arginine metabolism
MNARDQRRAMIADWLREGGVGGQEMLFERLGKAGVAATQATVSRDLEALGAVRVRSGYVLAEGLRATGPGLAAMVAQWVTSIIAAGPLVVLRTPPGSANIVAHAIDQAALVEIAGTIAGDDTVFVALSDGIAPGDAAAMFRALRAQG